MMRLSPTRSRATLLAVPAVLIAAVLIAALSRPSAVTPVPTSSQIALGTGVQTQGAPTAKPPQPATAAPTVGPTVGPTPDTCVLPAELPLAGPPISAPVVEGSTVSMLFASHLYAEAPDGSLVVRDDPAGDWAMGLWFVAAGAEEARLLLAPPDGMVLPLALSPGGDLAAVWWLPDRRTQWEPACSSGVYVLSMTTGKSYLVASGDWTISEDEYYDGVVSWSDPVVDRGVQRRYGLPQATFSSVGNLALIDGDEITIYLPFENKPLRRHTGLCSEWAWAPVGTVFVAGCEDMTSAWLVDVDGEFETETGNIALPQPQIGALHPGWEAQPGRAIGLTRDGRIRVVRFYGFATGCEDADCVLPPVAYAVTTIDRATGETSSRTVPLDTIVSFDREDTTRLSSDATWIYADLDQGAGTIRFAAGELVRGKRLRTFIGAAPDGSRLFGARNDPAARQVVVSSINATGTTRQVAVIRWADGAIALDPIIAVPGLVVTVPLS